MKDRDHDIITVNDIELQFLCRIFWTLGNQLECQIQLCIWAILFFPHFLDTIECAYNKTMFAMSFLIVVLSLPYRWQHFIKIKSILYIRCPLEDTKDMSIKVIC